MQKRIMVVQGSRELPASIQALAQDKTFDIRDVKGLSHATKCILQYKPALVLIEVEQYTEEVEDLLIFLSNLRNAHTIRRVVLAECAPVADVVTALEHGADDVILESLSSRELRARLAALLRAHPQAEEEQVLSAGGLRLFREDLEVEVGPEKKKLSRTEFNLLAFFMEHAGHVFSRDILLENLWLDCDELEYTRTVDVYICRIREKIEEDPAHPRRLVTRRGQGYVFIDHPETATEDSARDDIGGSDDAVA
jgi:two-component system response regulator VicR